MTLLRYRHSTILPKQYSNSLVAVLSPLVLSSTQTNCLHTTKIASNIRLVSFGTRTRTRTLATDVQFISSDGGWRLLLRKPETRISSGDGLFLAAACAAVFAIGTNLYCGDNQHHHPTLTTALLEEDDKSTSDGNNNDKVDRYNMGRWMNRWYKGTTGWHKDYVHPMLLKYTHLLFSDSSSTAATTATTATTDASRIVLIPLCGKSVDMKYLASLPVHNNDGFFVVGVDCSELALEQFASDTDNQQLQLVKKELNKKSTKQQQSIAQKWWLGRSIALMAGNFFELDQDDIVTAVTLGGTSNQRGKTNLQVNAIWDRGSLVAIDPSLREEYVQVIGRLISTSNNNSSKNTGGGGRYLLTTMVRSETSDTKKGPPYNLTERHVRDLFEKQPWVDSVELVETRSATADETSWIKTLMMWYRVGFFAKEQIFLIKTK